MVVCELDLGPITAPVGVSRFHVEPGEISTADRHRAQELWLVVSGRGRVLIGDSARDLMPGDNLFFDSNVEHQVHNPGPEPLECVSVWWAPPEQEDS